MRGKKFSWFLSGASALGAILGMYFMTGQMDRATEAPGERSLWVGAFFLMIFVFGFCALQLAMQLNRKYKVERNRLWWAAFLTACVLVFGIGVGGQYLFMYSKEEVEETVSNKVDMVLLLDASGSMEASGYNAPRTEAACQFVDSMSEDCRLQAVSFAGTVLDSTRLMPMNSTNKDILKQMITNIDSIGDTDFNEPLRQAMDTLNSNGHANSSKAVVLLTDGQGTLDSSVVDSYINSDVRVYTIRISDSLFLDIDEQALVDFAKNTGGFDTRLKPKYDGSVDTSDMLKAFQDAFKASVDTHTEVKMRDDLVICAYEAITFRQFIIRVIVFILYSIIIGFGYYGTVSLSSAIRNSVMGLIAAVLVSILEGDGALLIYDIVIVLLMGTAFVFIDLRGEDHFDV